MDDSSMVGGAAIVVALLTEAGKKMVTPVSEQLGLALGDLAGIYRFYQNENLGKVFTRWAEWRGDKPPLSQEDIRKVLPLLRLAAEQSDGDLQVRWAALLEHTVTSEGALPSFGQTLSQLTSEQAKFLDRLFALVTQPTGRVSEYSPGRTPLEHTSLIAIYDPSINTGVNPAERQIYKDILTEDQLENFAKLDRAELIIQDLERLGIIVQEKTSEPDQYFEIPRAVGGYIVDSTIAGKRVPLHRDRPVVHSRFSLSPYGLSFIRAVSPTKV
jgi:hypothetical protein